MLLEGLSWLENPEAQAHMRVNVQLWAEALRSPQVREVFERANFDTWREALAGLMRRGQERGQISRSLDADSAARLLMSAWHGLVLQRAFDPEMDVSKYVTVLKAMYHGTFRVGGEPDR